MQFEHIVDVHLEQGRLAEVELGPTLYEEDSNGLKLGVRLWRNGEAVDVTGTVSGWAIVSTGQTISPFDDTGYDGNEAWVLVPQGALVPGRIEIFLRITGDSDSAVTLHATGTVRRTKTGEIIVPGDPLPDVDQIRTLLGDLNEAINNAEALIGNALRGILDYGYGTPGSASVGSANYTRNGILLEINGSNGNSQTAIKIRLNGEISAAGSTTAPAAWATALTLADGHTYRWKVRQVSGVSNKSPMARVYLGRSFTTTGTNEDGAYESVCTFVYQTGNPVNLCMVYARSGGAEFTDCVYECILTEVYGERDIPAIPSGDGTYTLQVTVADGVPTYAWVGGSANLLASPLASPTAVSPMDVESSVDDAERE